MSSDCDDCAALSEQISSTLNCDEGCLEARECCESTTDQNEETQKKVNEDQEKRFGEENSREEVKEKEKHCSDEEIIQLQETDSVPKNIDQIQYVPDDEDENEFPGIVPYSLGVTMSMSYAPKDAPAEENDEF